MKDFPLARSVRSCLIGTLILVLPMLFLSVSTLGGMYLAAYLLFLGPVALCVSALVCGSLPLLLGLGVALFSMGRVFGLWGALTAALYLIPVIAAFVVLVLRRVPFWRGCAILIGVHALSFAVIFLILQGLAGGDLYNEAGRLAMEAMAGWDMGDDALYSFYTTGMLELPASLEGSTIQLIGGRIVLPDEMRQDLLLSFRAMIISSLTFHIPGTVMVQQSILGGAGCMLLPLKWGRAVQNKREKAARAAEPGEQEISGSPEDAPETPKEASGAGMNSERDDPPRDFPGLPVPAFRTWHLPRGAGWKVGAALALGFFLQASGQAAVNVAGIMLYTLGVTLFSIQGAAFINDVQHKRGSGIVWRILIPLALFLIGVLMVMGVFDQVVNARGLRKPPEPKEEF